MFTDTYVPGPEAPQIPLEGALARALCPKAVRTAMRVYMCGFSSGFLRDFLFAAFFGFGFGRAGGFFFGNVFLDGVSSGIGLDWERQKHEGLFTDGLG